MSCFKRSLVGTTWKAAAVLGVLALAGGCETRYSVVRFRPVDTMTQLTLSGVEVRVAPRGSGGAGELRGTTDSHGQIDLDALRAGDVLVFSKPGYMPARIRLEPGGYRQRSPAGTGPELLMDLREMDAVPVPLHREGWERRPDRPLP